MWNVLLYELEFIHPLLRKIIAEKEVVFGAGTVTSLYRIDDPGVHGQLPLRGLDERCKYPPLGTATAKFINDRWEYDPERPEMKVCTYHDTGKGWHLHYQVHPNTRRREVPLETQSLPCE